jgi:hypothetical protein
MRDIIGAKRREWTTRFFKEILKFHVFCRGAVIQSIKRAGYATSRKRPIGTGLADNADDL